MEVKGYKVFDPDWSCRDKQYTCPGTFVEEVELELCGSGMHFCTELADCFNYYSFNPKNRVAEVIAHGNILQGRTKCCTDNLEIVRELSWLEVLSLMNQGEGNTGRSNLGDYNSGNFNEGRNNTGGSNTGDYNVGDRNFGCYNSGSHNNGDHNSGYYNLGDFNVGNYNRGDGNIGERNNGDYNSGDWNLCDYSTGCFNTIEQTIYLFNKPSSWTREDWEYSRARKILSLAPRLNPTRWIYWKEIEAPHPEAKMRTGYLERQWKSSSPQVWWDKLPEADKKTIMSIPNFDKDIFQRITAIDVEK
jgi:hypothetical protein